MRYTKKANSFVRQCETRDALQIAHEIGHDSEHRDEAKAGSLKEYSLYCMKDNKEYEANAFGAHILMDNDSVYRLVRRGYDLEHIAGMLRVDMNLTLIKMAEMNKMGYDFRMPCEPDGRYLRNIHVK